MQKTPRELNTAYDLAQQKVVHLKAHRYNFAPLNIVVQNWIQNPNSFSQTKAQKAS